jgi:RNA polymerase sigma factor (sigma-70 family)
VLASAVQAIRDGSFEYRGPGSLSGWLLTAVRNRIEDRRRYWEKRPTVAIEDDAGAAAGAAGGVAAPGPGPATSLLAKERSEHLQEALAQLPAEQHLVVELRIFHGLPWADVATQFERETGEKVDEEALRMRFLAIRRRLGLLLEALNQGD